MTKNPDSPVWPVPCTKLDEPGCCAAHDWGRHLAESAPTEIPDRFGAAVLDFIDNPEQTAPRSRPHFGGVQVSAV